jgi:uncharacterized membrane protein YeiB
MAVSDVCAMMLLMPTPVGQRVGQVLAPFGRMTLTNHINQKLIMVALHATVLTGRNTPTIALVTAVVIVAVQIPLSRWWLDRHRHDHWRPPGAGSPTGPGLTRGARCLSVWG